MKVLVTGGTGFTGSHLTRRLLERGHRVIVLDSRRGLFDEELARLGAAVHLGSVTDRALVWRLTEGCDVVYHLAAMFRLVNQPKRVYREVNVEGTRHLLEAALFQGVGKFVNCSTCGVHGNVKRTPSGEDAPIAPEDYYQYTKWEAERLVPEYVEKGLRTVTLRPAAIYGPGDPGRFLHLFRLTQTGRFLMFGDGETHYHPLYVDNLVDAFELAAASDRGSGEAYLVADERYWTLNELVAAIGKTLGVKLKTVHVPFWPLWMAALACETLYKPLRVDPPLFRRRVDWFRQNRAFDITRATRELGYRPAVGLDEGLARTADWYRRQGYLTRGAAMPAQA